MVADIFVLLVNKMRCEPIVKLYQHNCSRLTMEKVVLQCLHDLQLNYHKFHNRLYNHSKPEPILNVHRDAMLLISRLIDNWTCTLTFK